MSNLLELNKNKKQEQTQNKDLPKVFFGIQKATILKINIQGGNN